MRSAATTSAARALHRGGAPRKSPDGLGRVLYVRADDELVDLIEVAWEQAHRTNRRLSRADFVRQILFRALTGAAALNVPRET